MDLDLSETTVPKNENKGSSRNNIYLMNIFTKRLNLIIDVMLGKILMTHIVFLLIENMS